MAFKIYVDQGHNPRSFNTGAEGGGYFEQDITYRIGIILADYLRSDPNFEVRLSRPTPETILGTSNSSSLSERVRDANSWGADLFVSLHTNASVTASANGSECLVYSYSATDAVLAAENILDQLTLITGLRDRGIIERPGLYVLRRTAMPAVVVEMGFITNASDRELMVNSPNLFALGVYRGIVNYYGL
ncbi:MAG: N-acetylmuramoyl-L-alanine amidase [Clostridia bacterium]|nr:N-acetylmuramoyl-L-alanine amidase [Clostridia bacterium]